MKYISLLRIVDRYGVKSQKSNLVLMKTAVSFAKGVQDAAKSILHRN